MSIAQLDNVTVKKLTTAQVITSVFSVVKELVENALDAGANNIDVILEEQGLCSIEIRDNASGISEADSSFVALPAYTSKLSNFNDLGSLQTYGFRGEALCALCRVSDVTIITRTAQDDAARCYTFDDDGNIEEKKLCARSIGTTVQVLSLLKNIPVRRKIISCKKRANQDIEAIELLLQDYGVCHPNIRINYRVDNKSRFMKLPTDTVRESINNIFHKKVISNYEFLNYNNADVNIELIIPKIDVLDLSSVCQKVYSHIYINSRPVSYKELEKLIITILSEHFGEKMPSKKKPIFFLIIKVPPSEVDVNLEPNKTKVLLKNISNILKLVEKLLSDYYKISKVDEDLVDDVSAIMDESLVAFMDDDTESDDENKNSKVPSCKKRKVETAKAESKSNTLTTKVTTENKENENTPNNLNTMELEEETLSQLPKIDLGPDFTTQEIDSIPQLNPIILENIMNKLEQSVDDNKSSNILKVSETPSKVTDLQWSKGHVQNLKGGMDVQILGLSNVPTKKKKALHDGTTNPSTRGFLKFSERIGQEIQQDNPGVDFVTIAKSIATKWKQLPRIEREHYRELGRQDISVDSKLNNSCGKKRLAPENVENNKKRMRNLLAKMENLHAHENDDTSENLKSNTKIPKTHLKSVRYWELDKKQLKDSSCANISNKENINLIIGPVNENIWTVSTNSQIWALNLKLLLDSLNVNHQERAKIQGKQELIETYFKRGLNETDNTNFIHPIYSK